MYGVVGMKNIYGDKCLRSKGVVRREGEGFECFPLHWRHTGNLREEQWNLREDNGTYVKTMEPTWRQWNLREEMEPTWRDGTYVKRWNLREGNGTYAKTMEPKWRAMEPILYIILYILYIIWYNFYGVDGIINIYGKKYLRAHRINKYLR